MPTEPAPAGTLDGLLSFPRRWFQPRSKDRDEAFRERSIRVAIALVVLIGLMSFVLTIFVFRNAWSLVSYPTLHVVVLFGFFIAAYTVAQEKVNEAATIVVATSLIAAFGFILVIGRQEAYGVLLNGVPVFMFVILLTALVMPRNTILPVSLISVGLYVLAILGTQESLQALSGLEISQTFFTAFLLFPTEGAILYRLRVEFDSRLDAMRESIRAAELAQQQAEAARQQAEIDRRRAEESDKAKSQFLANMSHELRTPLNAIIGYDEAMLGGLAGEFAPLQLKLLGHIQYNSRRLLGLINDILDLAKIESGSLQAFLAPMSPQKVVRETVESLRSLADEKGLHMAAEFSDTVPEVVLGDANKIQQILANLLGNAIKFTDTGSVTVAVSIVDQANWQIQVKDTGIGMPDGAKDYIFEPFLQVDGTEKRQYKGTGLGLAITQRLVDGLGGTIDVESKLGEGSVFIVKLPRANVPEVVEPDRTLTEEPAHE